MKKDPINNPKDLFDYLYHSMRDRPQECFTIIFLDAKNKIITLEVLFTGTLTASSVYPREVLLAALRHNAAALIFVHNHPSGDPNPSRDDEAITRQLIFACRSVDIIVHEHLIIGDNRYFSFADQGLIAEMNKEFEKRLNI